MSTKQEKNSIRVRKHDIFLLADILVYLLNSSYLMNGLENSIEIYHDGVRYYGSLKIFKTYNYLLVFLMITKKLYFK